MSETHDSWKAVERWDVAGTYVERMRVKFAGHPNGGWMRSTEVDAARAAEATQYQQLVEHLQHQVTAGLEDYHALYARLAAVEAERDRLKAALERLRDCDWTIGRGDRMDAVRDIARAALSGEGTAK